MIDFDQRLIALFAAIRHERSHKLSPGTGGHTGASGSVGGGGNL